MQPGPPVELVAQSPPPELFAGGPELETTPLPISDCGPPTAGEELLELHDVEDVAARIRLRWMTASFLVAVMHVGTAYAVLNWPDPPLPSGEPPAAIMIELAPMPVAPETPPQEVAVGEQSLVSEQETPSEESKAEPTETEVEKTETEPTPDTAEKVEEPVEQAEADIPKLAPAPDADAVLPLPAKEPQKEEPIEAKKPEPVEKKEPEKPKPEPEPEPQESRPQPKSSKPSAATAAPKPVTAPRAKTNAAPSPGTSSSQSMASWRGMVVAKINRHKRHPGGSVRGTSSVAFTIDRSGRVLSARLIRSSGSKALDAEAVALARRASPVPPPPANIGGGSIVLTVPIRFSR